MKTTKKLLSMLLAVMIIVSIIPVTSIEAGAANSMVETAINWAVSIANDDNYGYSQVNRYGNPDYDCSSLVSTAFHNAGFNVACTLNTRTMKDAFVNAGFTWIPANEISGFPSSCANLQRGDILLASGHTELYIGDGKNVGAHMDYNGIPGGIGGGKTWSDGYNAYRYGADEIDVCNYWNDNWLGVLRYGDSYTEPPEAPKVYLSRNILAVNETVTLYWDSADRTEYYWISCWSETTQCISEKAYGLSKEISFSEPGRYSVTVVSGNNKGETIGNWINFEVYDTNGYNIIEYDSNGGSGYMSAHNVYYNSTFSLKESTFTKTGYKQVGWNAYRISDGKWFAYGQGWKTEDEIINNGWSKSIYPNPIENWTFDWSWYDGGVLNDTIIFYAVWEKLNTYTITYNANGGTGAPSSQTKTYGKTLTLSSTIPTRIGYTFLGWSTSSTATSATYSAGDSFTTNANTTLYAVWKANTYTISYNANGGTGAPSSQTKTYGKTLTLSSTIPTRTGYTFLGWSTSPTVTTATYSAGGSFTTNATTTLYAVWAKDGYDINSDGIVDSNDTGLYKHDGTWYYVVNGNINYDYTGLIKHTNGIWYYVEDGILDWSYSGLWKHNGTWYYVQKGQINWKFTGLVKHTNGIWYYVQGAKLNWNKTGLVKHTNGIWYYVQKGQLNWNKTGLVKHTDGNWYYVQKGQINWNYTGLVKHTNGKYYYVQKGKLNWKYTGYAYYNGKKYKVVNGVKV